MARPIVLSNGNLHIGINKYGLVHDVYYPYVGLENHSYGRELRHKVGVWVDGKISWLDDGNWTIRLETQNEFLGGHVRAANSDMGVLVEFDDIVDSTVDALIRSIHVVNTRNETREIRLFIHQAFVIGDSRSNTDTAQYLPDNHAIVHYRGDRAFVAGAKDDKGKPFDQFSIGLFAIEGREGSYRDADDGDLQGCTVEHGRVDSTIRFRLHVDGHASRRVYYWLSAGTSVRDALQVHKTIDIQGFSKRHHETTMWWKKWLTPTSRVAKKLPKQYRDGFTKSSLVLKSHIDNRGAIIASTDTSMLNYWRDVYGYCWPRDGAYVIWPLIRLGYEDEPLKFFDFCKEQLHPRGYLQHKYRADGALGSSWHSYVHDDDTVAAPIQEDETAIVLFSFTQYYHSHPSAELLDKYYVSFIKPMANFISQYIDDSTHLPKPSYDLWEEVFITSTYTTAVVHAALLAAAELADILHDDTSAVAWRAVAEDMQRAAHSHLYSHDRGLLRKGVLARQNGSIEYNDTLDVASFYGCFMFGLFEATSDEIVSTRNKLQEVFGWSDEQPALPRYEHDNYQRMDGQAPNKWFITSLWLAQYDIETGNDAEAAKILTWVEDHMGETGHLSEQISAQTDTPISVSPLVWSHAEYMATLLDTIVGAEK